MAGISDAAVLAAMCNGSSNVLPNSRHGSNTVNQAQRCPGEPNSTEPKFIPNDSTTSTEPSLYRSHILSNMLPPRCSICASRQIILPNQYSKFITATSRRCSRLLSDSAIENTRCLEHTRISIYIDTCDSGRHGVDALLLSIDDDHVLVKRA